MYERTQSNLHHLKGKHHRTVYFMGRRHVIFVGRLLRTMRVWQWQESEHCHRELFDRF